MLNMRNNNSNFVTGLLKDLRKTSRCLKEAYIFDDDDWKINKLFLKTYMRQALNHNR